VEAEPGERGAFAAALQEARRVNQAEGPAQGWSCCQATRLRVHRSQTQLGEWGEPRGGRHTQERKRNGVRELGMGMQVEAAEGKFCGKSFCWRLPPR